MKQTLQFKCDGKFYSFSNRDTPPSPHEGMSCINYMLILKSCACRYGVSNFHNFQLYTHGHGHVSEPFVTI